MRRIHDQKARPKVQKFLFFEPVSIHWYFVTKIVLTYLRKKYSSDRKKLNRLKAENLQNF